MSDEETVQDTEERGEKREFNSLEDLPEFWQNELKSAREEAAERRVALKERDNKLSSLEEKISKLQNKEELEEVERLREDYKELKQAKEARDAEYERMQQEYQFVSFAAKMGVSPEVASLIDVTKLDLDDEEALKERLKPLAQKRAPSGGDPSNPANDGRRDTLTDKERLNKYLKPGGRGAAKAFGDN